MEADIRLAHAAPPVPDSFSGNTEPITHWGGFSVLGRAASVVCALNFFAGYVRRGIECRSACDTSFPLINSEPQDV